MKEILARKLFKHILTDKLITFLMNGKHGA